MRRLAILGVVALGLLAGSYLLMNARTVQLFGETCTACRPASGSWP